MGKMSELDSVIRDLRKAASAIKEAADTLAEMFGGKEEVPEKQEAPKPTVTLEQVRAVLAEKSHNGFTEQVRELAVRVYKAMGCRGMSRVDFFVKSDGEVVFNEINTIPGFTSISMYPKLFEASGIPYSDLLDDLIALALEA